MPTVYLHWEPDDFNRTVAQLMNRTKYKTLPDFLRWRASIVVKDLVALTPPRSKKDQNVTKSGEPNWKAMKEAGENRIKFEIQRLFPDMTAVHAIQHPFEGMVRWAKDIQRYIDAEHWDAVLKMLKDAGMKSDMILREATVSIHRGARRTRGRVDPRVRYPVMRPKSVQSVIREAIKGVGKLKGGWTEAVKKLAVKRIPQWITGKNSPGYALDNTTAQIPNIEVVNRAPATKDMNPNEIVGVALMMNENKMRKELAAKMDWELRKASRKR